MSKSVKVLLAAVCLLGCISSFIGLTQGEDLDWWESASLYQIYPRSFQDSNGDGVGDLNGITERLQYLKEIGITATWLSPIFKSPMSDFGYDVSDFKQIDPIFGTQEDFDAMIAKAKQLGLKILLDFVPNHSSDECEWFQKSIKRQDGYEDFYVWDDGKIDPTNSSNRLPPSNWVSVFGGPAWTWNEERGQFYLHQFQAKQPDMNYSNQMVREHMLDVLKHWLDLGVDGFRIDAVPHVFEKRNDDGSFPDEPLSGWNDDPNNYDYLNHIYTKDQDKTLELIYEWRAFLDDYQNTHNTETKILLAEAYSSVETLNKYVSNGTVKGAHLPMNFNLMGLTGYSNANDVNNEVSNWMDTIWKNHKMANWVVGNHDNSRVVDRIGRHKADLLNIIVNTLPGVSITYYGEEIGMENVPTECGPISCDDRDPERSPMQWSPKAMADFTSGTSTWLPIADNYKTYNVQTERGVSRSSLQVFKILQNLKQTSAFKALKEEDGFSYGPVTDQVFQIIRAKPGLEEYRVLVNMGNKLESLKSIGDKVMEYVLVSSYSPHRLGETVDLNTNIFMMPYEAVILRWKA